MGFLFVTCGRGSDFGFGLHGRLDVVGVHPSGPLFRPLLRRLELLLLDELLHPRDGLVHGHGADDAELEEVAAVKDKVAVEIALHEFATLLLDKHLEGEIHLAVADIPKTQIKKSNLFGLYFIGRNLVSH